MISLFFPPPFSSPKRASPGVYGARKLRCEPVLERARGTARKEREQGARSADPMSAAPATSDNDVEKKTMRDKKARFPCSFPSRSCPLAVLAPRERGDEKTAERSDERGEEVVGRSLSREKEVGVDPMMVMEKGKEKE